MPQTYQNNKYTLKCFWGAFRSSLNKLRGRENKVFDDLHNLLTNFPLLSFKMCGKFWQIDSLTVDNEFYILLEIPGNLPFSFYKLNKLNNFKKLRKLKKLATRQKAP